MSFGVLQVCLGLQDGGFVFQLLFRTRTRAQTIESRLCGREVCLRLVNLRAKLAVFETDEDLSFLNVVALLNADPCDASHHFRAHRDLVMGHDVT